MIQKIERASDAYAVDKVALATRMGRDSVDYHQSLLPKFCGFDISEAFQAGVEFVLDNQWYEFGESYPSASDSFVLAYDNGYHIARYNEDDETWFNMVGQSIKPSYWMPLPSIPKAK